LGSGCISAEFHLVAARLGLGSVGRGYKYGNESPEQSLRGLPPLNIPHLLIRMSGEAGLKLEGGVTEIWLLHFLETCDQFGFLYPDFNLGERSKIPYKGEFCPNSLLFFTVGFFSLNFLCFEL
jgi:hypothetical protein